MLSSDSAVANYRQIDDEEFVEYERPPKRVYGFYRKLFTIAFALGWAVTLVLYWQLSIATRRSFTPIPSYIFHSSPKTFHHDEDWSGMSKETQRRWNAQFAGNGALWVENPKQFGLPRGIVAEFDHPGKSKLADDRFYIVSKLHELHCLSMIRWHWWGAVMGDSMSEIEDANLFAVHVGHCFEYLRQAITCGGGDIILEGYSPLTNGTSVSTSVSGWGREHKCINFQALAEYQIDQEAKYNLTWQEQK